MRFEHHISLAELIAVAQVRFHGVELERPDFSYPSRSLALSASSLSGDLLMYFALNAYWHPLEFELPPLPKWATSGWRRVVDTYLPAPDDIAAPEEAPPVTGATYEVGPRSVVVLFAAAAPAEAPGPHR